MYESVNASFDGMECTRNAGYVICIISCMKLCSTRPIKCISKTFAYLIMKKIWIDKNAKLLSHSIFDAETYHFSLKLCVLGNY